MTAPLAQCITAGCASIVPATAFQKASICAALIVLGLLVLAALIALFDAAPLKHLALHRFWRSGYCGRCISDAEADYQDGQMNSAAARSGPVSLAVRRAS